MSAAAKNSYQIHSKAVNQVIQLMVISCAIFCLLRLGELFKIHVLFPMDIGIETPNVIASEDIRWGRGIYHKKNIEGPPFHILSYTPLYHALVGSLPRKADNFFLSGRLVSAFFTLCFLALFSRAGKRFSWASMALGAAAFALVDVVSLNTFVYESAHMGLFFSLAAVALLDFAGPRAVAGAGILCAVAFMSKQNYVAAAAAIGLHLLIKDWRQAALFTGVYLVCMGAGLGLITWNFGEGFWISTFGFLENTTFSTAHLVQNLGKTFKDPLFTFTITLAVGLLARASMRTRLAVWRQSPRAAYFVVALAIACMGLRHVGGGPNYLSEPLAAGILLLAQMTAGPEMPLKGMRVWGPAALFLLSAYKIGFKDPADYSLGTDKRQSHLEEKHIVQGDLARIGLEKPRVLNLVDSPTGLLVSPAVEMSDVYHMSMLWRRGAVSIEGLLAEVGNKAYDIIVLPTWVGPDAPARHAHLEPLRVRIFANYKIAFTGRYFNYLRPK